MNHPLRILFMGTSDFAVPALRLLVERGFLVKAVVTQPDRPAGRGMELKASPVKKAALELGLLVEQPEKIKNPEVVEKLRTFQPDVVVVASYGQILPPAVLEIPSLACLNIHGSILPRYRGAAPIHYAVMAGDKETGVTLMYMNEKMDEGDILLVRKTPIGPLETTGEVHDRLALLGAEGLVEALELLKRDQAPREPQNHLAATYAPSLHKEQCQIDWKNPANEVVNKIRGLTPWPSAQTHWKDLPLKIFNASIEREMGLNHKPGEIISIEKGGMRVAVGDGVIFIGNLQAPGKRKMSPFEFNLGHGAFKPGERLS